MTTGPPQPGVFCRHAGVCGGCSLLHLSYAEQLASKDAALRSLFAPHLPREARSARSFFTGDSVASSPPFDGSPGPGQATVADPERFRQKAAFVFAPGPDGRGLTMGHFARGSQRVVAIEECPVHSERANRIAFALRDRLLAAGIGAAGGRGRAAVLRHLIVRTTADDREAVAMLVVTRNDKALRRPIRALLESRDRPDGLFININDEPGPFMVGETTIRIDGIRHVRERVGGVSFLVSPAAFFQTNVRAAGVLQGIVVRSVSGAERVLDLYCGSGLLTLPLALAGARVTGVEENAQAIRDANANAALNRVPEGRVRFVAGRVDHVLPRLRASSWDAVVLDPPRQGCGSAVIDAVFAGLAPPRVTYVSCNPEALRDELPAIEAAGYRLAALRAVDMFPHTDHVEAIAQFRPSGGARTSREAS
ncbi:MAG: 23S rRNA (uracil(1939)-C(5))-methyltransferase RlmD [Vicinamibacterales bacterium]